MTPISWLLLQVYDTVLYPTRVIASAGKELGHFHRHAANIAEGFHKTHFTALHNNSKPAKSVVTTTPDDVLHRTR